MFIVKVLITQKNSAKWAFIVPLLVQLNLHLPYMNIFSCIFIKRKRNVSLIEPG
jgi:hypothetical protein